MCRVSPQKPWARSGGQDKDIASQSRLLRHYDALKICTERPAAGGKLGVLDFGGTSDVVFVAEGGLLTLRGIALRGLALPNSRGAEGGLLLLRPSLQLAPGAHVSGSPSPNSG